MLWLGGAELAELDEGTVFTIIDGRGLGKVTRRSRDGLVGVGIVEGVAKEGMLLRKT
jgi:hypothetical protein